MLTELKEAENSEILTIIRCVRVSFYQYELLNFFAAPGTIAWIDIPKLKEGSW